VTGIRLGRIVAATLQAGPGAGEALLSAFLGVFGVALLVTAVSIAGVWKTFEKAGQPGWAAVVPVYNVYVLVAEVADRDSVWVPLSVFVPFLVVVPMIDVAESFGKGTGYGVGLAVLGFVFFPLLGFGDARYRGSSPY